MPEILFQAKAAPYPTLVTASIATSNEGGPCPTARIVPLALKAKKIALAIIEKEPMQPSPLHRIIDPLPIPIYPNLYPYHFPSPYLESSYQYVPIENLREVACCCVIS